MAVSAKLFLKGYGAYKAAAINWASDTIKCALLEGTYTPDQDADEFWSEISADEASGTGYTAGGEELSGTSVALDDASNQVRLLADDVEWDPSSITAAYAVVYKDTGSAETSRLLGFVDFDGDQTSVDARFAIEWANGRVAVTTLD